jgi:outer membrane receptor protein involved in Fe transport
VWSYEIGAKDRAFDGKFTSAMSAYVIKWNNIQQQIMLPFCGYALVDNLGSATIKGFDLTLSVAPLVGLNLTAAFAYTHTALDNGLYQPGGTVVYSKGSAILNAGPPWTEVLTGEYSAPVMADVAGYFHVDATHTSAYARTGQTDPAAFNFDPLLPPQTATTLINARLGIRRDSLDVSLFCNNMFDSHPLLNLSHIYSPAYVWTATTFRPRTVGITMAYHF